ncbi:hypothetical protein D0962_23185 [Leptolyngbyaceae cyanobacterium CCMR0082]|uniref:Uncharacterized protein n=1 Tax=Adonisia turfae CCMR0082 TaxID=2304604 RepID=A0A6M0SAY7_9CYAN|nr:hypothetical protein [Adonisia turfae]NEZ65624.1 hypothetical protein [Adonisia turfae CCMR0082]
METQFFNIYNGSLLANTVRVNSKTELMQTAVRLRKLFRVVPDISVCPILGRYTGVAVDLTNKPVQ